MRNKLLYLILMLFVPCTMFNIGSLMAQEITVCSYNLRYKNTNDTNAGNGWNTRRNYLAKLVSFQQPDLLGVQEAVNSQMNDMASRLDGYAYVGVGRDNGATSGEYSAIFYRKETMVLLDNGDFWLSDTPYKASKGFPSQGGSTTYNRICSWGKFFHKPTGTVIFHFNTHMDLDETNRQQSYYLIKQKIQEIASTTSPVIISGDYNAVQTGDAYKLFYNSGFLYDCFERAKQKFITNGTCPGFDANNYSTVSGDYRRIDHIFVTRTAFNIEHYGVLNSCYYSEDGSADYHVRAFSDHSPVLVKLTLKKPEMAELPTTPPPLVNGVYQLSTPEELQTFSYIVNGIAGFSKNPAAKAVLLNDIDLKGKTTWSPIGNSSSPFTGTFDGQGHSITNVAVKTNKSYSGLFGNTSGATIKDFYVDGTLVVAEGSSEHGAVGYASNTTITDVHSALNITTNKANDETRHIGGIAGSMASGSNISRCSYAGTLTDAGTNTIGGIVGYADGSNNIISHALNSGRIQAKGSTTLAGGILGYVNYANFNISHCLNVGNVTGAKDYAGQIVGRQVKAMTTLPTDLYYLETGTLDPFGTGTEAASIAGATAVNEEQLASGEVCYNLNGDQSEIIWYQTLPGSDATVQADAYPVLYKNHLQVWRYDDLFSNDSPDAIKRPTPKSLTPSLSKGEGVIYNLAGQRISKLQKGINIVNGKKVLK